MELYEKVQKWIDSIISDNLENVAIETKNFHNWNKDPKLNRMIFRALLCLSHTAERAKPAETKLGTEMFNIADNLRYSLTEIPDLMKYFLSLYHIVRKLIAMGLYSEAMRATVWSFPNNLVHSLNSQHFDMYPKIASLWHETGISIVETLPSSKSVETDYYTILKLLHNELTILEIVAGKRSALVLSRVIRYLIKLDAVSTDLEPCKYPNHRYLIINFLNNIKVSLIGDEKYDVYYEALTFVNCVITAAVKHKSVENAPKAFTESCDIMEKIFHRDLELAACFSLYKNMGILLLRPVDKSNKIAHWELAKIEKETLNILKNFKHGKGILWNMKMAGYILQAQFNHWENCVSAKDERFLNISLLHDILGFIKLMFDVLNSIETKSCEICRDRICRMEKNTYTVTVVSVRSLVILSKISADDLLKDIFDPIKQLLEENVAALFEMKESDCAQWSSLWRNCGINIYNFGVDFYKKYYDQTIFLFSLLCSSIVKFEGINVANSKINIKDPLSTVLHRLSTVHYNHGNYREALTPCALNGLLSYQNPDSKAFRMWANIKHASVHSESILKMTMISCLRKDMDVISEIGVNVNLRDYDLVDLCLQELRGLHDGRCNLSLAMQSVLDELDTLNSGGLEYAQGVHLLGYHQLNYQFDDNFPCYLKLAVNKIKEDQFSGDLQILASASINFYTFVMDLCNIADQTKAAMETTKFILTAKKSRISHDGLPKNNDAVVPSYSKINISEDSKLFSHLQLALIQWGICVESNIIGVIEQWHLALTLRTLVIAAEYCRLHGYSTLETNAWELSYKIASQLKDYRTCVYVVGRGISLRNLNSEWINTANNLMTELQPSTDMDTDNAICFFWLSLSNLYFEFKKEEEASEIMGKVLSLANVTPVKNVPGYVASMVTILRNYSSFAKVNRSKKYMVYIVKLLYAMLSLMEYTPQPRIGARERQLHSNDVLLTCTAHLALRMNSLLSFKEISSHIINRLKLSQASGSTLRVAECLKNLCFIDLSRMQLDDCVVKLQGLEFVLQTEYIGDSQNTKNPKISANELQKPGSRDPRTNDASPILRKTVFKVPEFMSHSKCSCYKCSSVEYQYLVLSNAHIRAQLYFLQGHLNEALQHFNGAFYLYRKMLRIESSEKIKWEEMNDSNEKEHRHLWKDYYRNVEYVLLLLDFSRFVRELEFNDGINVAINAVDICENFRLTEHPVYLAAKELLLEYQFCEIIREDDFSLFTVPDPASIDIKKFTQSVNSVDLSTVSTPASKPPVNKPKSVCRIKTPPLLKLTKVSMNLSDDEDGEGSESPKSSYQRSKVGKNYRRPKTLTRKKLQKYLEDSADPSSAKDKEQAGAVGISRLKIPGELIPAGMIKKEKVENGQETISQMINRAASIFPNLSKQIIEVSNKEEMNDSEKIQYVIRLVEERGTNAGADINLVGRRQRGKSKDRLGNGDENDVVEKLVASFKEILISGKNAESSGHKKSKKRIDFTEFPENCFDIEERAIIPKPEPLQRKERVRTSVRVKSSEQFESVELEEKLKSLSKRRIKDLPKDSDGLPASGHGKIEKEIEVDKQKPHYLQRLEKLKLEISDGLDSSVDIIEGSQFENSDIIPTSDLEEKALAAAGESRRNGLRNKSLSRPSSRVTRSRSQFNGNGTSSKLNYEESSDSVSPPEPEEESPETTKRDNNSQKGKSKSLSRAKKAAKSSHPESTFANNSSNEEDEKKGAESAAKKRTSKRGATGRSKVKR